MISYHGDYKDVLEMVSDACKNVFYDGVKNGKQNTVIECATQIYIKQMELMAGADPTYGYFDAQSHRFGNNIEEVTK